MRPEHDLSRKGVMTAKGVFLTGKGLTARRPADFHIDLLINRGAIARHRPKETKWKNQRFLTPSSPPPR